jgi:hypothetical protein
LTASHSPKAVFDSAPKNNPSHKNWRLPVFDSQWRTDLAGEIAKYYDAKVIILVGSPVIADAHAYSDLDIVMYWDGMTVPSDTERVAIAVLPKVMDMTLAQQGHSIKQCDLPYMKQLD